MNRMSSMQERVVLDDGKNRIELGQHGVPLGEPHNGMVIYGMGKMLYIHSELLVVV